MKNRFALLIILLCLIVLSSANAQDYTLTSDEPPFPCPYTNGAYYQGGLYPYYNPNTQTLDLIDPSTDQVARTLDTFTNDVRLIDWSPDCRYLTGAVGEFSRAAGTGDNAYVTWQYKNIVIWDTVQMQRAISIQHPGGALNVETVIWKPDSTYALILGGCPRVFFGCVRERIQYDILWNSVNNSALQVGGYELQANPRISGYGVRYNRALFNQYFWDDEHNWLWGSAYGGATAYDLDTRVEAAFFPSSCPNEGCFESGESRFTFSPDGTKVISYTTAHHGSLGRGGFDTFGGIAVHDIATREAIYVDADGFGAPDIPFVDYHPVALSSDNRYLIAGYDAIRVWDIQNLSADALPIYRHGGPDTLINSLRFSDWGVIETTSGDGVQHWDLHTGVYIP